MYMAKKKGGYAKYFVWMTLAMIAGFAAILLPIVFSASFSEQLYVTIMLVTGAVLLFIALLCLFVGLVEKHKKQHTPDEELLQNCDDVSAQIVAPDDISSEKVRYISSESVYEFVRMGDRQSVEEKFNEISKMDKTQFVIYVARLFSRRGYQVKFTPVVDNHNVDLLVEKMGVTIAVGCLLTSKVLCESDIRGVYEGSARYAVSNVMALTNMYFDKTAVDFAKRQRMSLVDRNILAEDFM